MGVSDDFAQLARSFVSLRASSSNPRDLVLGVRHSRKSPGRPVQRDTVEFLPLGPGSSDSAVVTGISQLQDQLTEMETRHHRFSLFFLMVRSFDVDHEGKRDSSPPSGTSAFAAHQRVEESVQETTARGNNRPLTPNPDSSPRLLDRSCVSIATICSAFAVSHAATCTDELELKHGGDGFDEAQTSYL
ncbi:unnamed protein product [Pleuronectes platessa]|uniref:Uncharacterized protein n=1 Tax=Pleuronectes platessa TaxID=8262 RepID=A0A9N7YT85_PLEPL|nr:unnamed protein product [Pleuronectes platessa]